MFSISFKRETTWDKVPFTITNFSFFSQPNLFFFFLNQSCSFQHQLKQTAISRGEVFTLSDLTLSFQPNRGDYIIKTTQVNTKEINRHKGKIIVSIC